MQHVFLNTVAFMTAEGLDATIPHFQPPPKRVGANIHAMGLNQHRTK